MEQYVIRRGDTLSAIARRLNISLPKLIYANRQIRNPDKIFVGQFINLPIDVRHPPGSPSGPSVADVLGQGAVSFTGDPAADPRFVENAVTAIGILIWGGPFALYRKIVNERGVDPIMLPRKDVSLSSDPLGNLSTKVSVLYSTRQYAEAALANSKLPNPFTYYIGEGGLLFPTTISETTAPALCAALRQAVERERKDANAAADLAFKLLLWYVGARFPPKIGGAAPAAAPAAAADTALAGFTAAEKAVISETRQILASPEMMQIRHAQGLGQEITVKIGGRLIQYEPNWPFSGITNFEGNGFTMGRESFSSESELTKTILHELYRLTTSVARGTAGGGANNVETHAAFEFAERAYQAVFASPK